MNDLIFDKYSKLPKELQKQVLDFIEFLLVKYQKQHNSPKRKSNFGSAKGMILMSEDFDEPLNDFKDYS